MTNKTNKFKSNATLPTPEKGFRQELLCNLKDYTHLVCTLSLIFLFLGSRALLDHLHLVLHLVRLGGLYAASGGLVVLTLFTLQALFHMGVSSPAGFTPENYQKAIQSQKKKRSTFAQTAGGSESKKIKSTKFGLSHKCWEGRELSLPFICNFFIFTATVIRP